MRASRLLLMPNLPVEGKLDLAAAARNMVTAWTSDSNGKVGCFHLFDPESWVIVLRFASYTGNSALF